MTDELTEPEPSRDAGAQAGSKASVKKSKVVWIVLIVLVFLALALSGGYYYYKNYLNKKSSTQEPASSSQSSNNAPTSSDNNAADAKTAGWKTYTSEELGLSFKYPEKWGEPRVQAENYSAEKNTGFTGKYYAIFFDTTNQYPARVSGYSSDFSAYGTGYIGDKTNLDLPEILTPTKSEDQYNIYVIRKKVTVAGIKTYYDIDFSYLPEASGVSLATVSYLNGKKSYNGILISRGFSTLNDKLDATYNGAGNAAVEQEGKQIITDMYDQSPSDQTALSQYQDYLLWLTTFQYIN